VVELGSIDKSKLPRHIAIIMDGNGRWAKARGMPRVYGHKKGVDTAKRIIEKTWELGIPYLSLFAFSKENWERPRDEVETLFFLLEVYLDKELPDMQKKGIRFRAVGDVDAFPDRLKIKIREVEEATRKNNRLNLCLALNYGGKQEILSAVKKIAKAIKRGSIEPEELDESLFRNFLHTKDIPDPDLLIRTSGEMRISNFYLFQLAYTELYFTPVCWPDFNEEEYMKALLDYQKRERRFGRVHA